jgi:hypothetical protein
LRSAAEGGRCRSEEEVCRWRECSEEVDDLRCSSGVLALVLNGAGDLEGERERARGMSSVIVVIVVVGDFCEYISSSSFFLGGLRLRLRTWRFYGCFSKHVRGLDTSN